MRLYHALAHGLWGGRQHMGSRSKFFGVFAVLTGVVGSLQACSQSVVAIDDVDEGGTITTVDASTDRNVPPAKDAGRDSATPADASRPDSALPADGGGDASTGDRPGDPFDPLAPKPGDPCPAGVQVNDTIDRRCGKCGTQRALCDVGRVVGAYGACANERTEATACLPGERKSQACGTCGRQSVQCDTTCAYVAGACTGEVAGGCVAGSVRYLSTCADPNEVKRQECSATCQLGTPGPCAPRGADVSIPVAQTAGGKVTQTLAVEATRKALALNVPYCPTALHASIMSVFGYVMLTNAGAQPANVTVVNKSATEDAVFAAYAGTSLPADRLACQDHVGINRFTVTIPAGGSQLVYVGGLSAAAAGPFPLEVVTNFLGAEVAGAPDHVLAISQTMGGLASQALTFDTAKFAPATAGLNAPTDYTGEHACPVVKMGAEVEARYVRLTNSGATDRTVNLVTTSVGDDSYMAVYTAVPTLATRRACVGTYNDDCTAADYNACLNGVTVPANGSVVVYVGQDTADGVYDTNTLEVTTTN